MSYDDEQAEAFEAEKNRQCAEDEMAADGRIITELRARLAASEAALAEAVAKTWEEAAEMVFGPDRKMEYPTASKMIADHFRAKAAEARASARRGR